MAKIVIAGSVNSDCAVYTPRFPVDGESVIGDAVRFSPGGKGLNQATAANRAGAETIMIAKYGKDFMSNVVSDHYDSEGMTKKYLTLAPDVETGFAIIEIHSGCAQNRIVIVKGANAKLLSQDVMDAEAEFATASIVLSQLESTIEAVEACKKLAQKYHIPFVLNSAPLMEVPAELFNGIDYVTPNETEAAFFTGVEVTDAVTAKRAAEKLLSMGVKAAIITLGKHGSYYYDGKEEYLVPCVDTGKPVDTTGAGDCFNGSLCVALAEGKDILSALRFASCAAGISVTRQGSAVSMPKRDEIDALYQKNFG